MPFDPLLPPISLPLSSSPPPQPSPPSALLVSILCPRTPSSFCTHPPPTLRQQKKEGGQNSGASTATATEKKKFPCQGPAPATHNPLFVPHRFRCHPPLPSSFDDGVAGSGLCRFRSPFSPWFFWGSLSSLKPAHRWMFWMTGRRPLKTPAYIKSLFAEENVVVMQPNAGFAPPPPQDLHRD